PRHRGATAPLGRHTDDRGEPRDGGLRLGHPPVAHEPLAGHGNGRSARAGRALDCRGARRARRPLAAAAHRRVRRGVRATRAAAARGARRRSHAMTNVEPPVTPSGPKPELDVRPLAAVSSAHFVVDAYSNMYAPLLPLLMPKLSLGLQGAGTLMMVFQAAASLSQLLFGRMADRGHARLLLMGGPLIAAVTLSLLGYVTTTGMLAAVLVIGGLGIAAFHPPGAMVAHTTGHRKPGTAMSVFITSGTLGFAVAPLVVATTADYYGLGSTAWFLLPGVVFSLLFARTVPALPLGPVRRSGGGLAALRPQMGPLFILYVLVVLRTLVSLS